MAAQKQERKARLQPHEKGASKKAGRVSYAGDGNDLKGELINEYLRKFPTSRRRGQDFDHSGGSKWKNME